MNHAVRRNVIHKCTYSHKCEFIYSYIYMYKRDNLRQSLLIILVFLFFTDPCQGGTTVEIRNLCEM